MKIKEYRQKLIQNFIRRYETYYKLILFYSNKLEQFRQNDNLMYECQKQRWRKQHNKYIGKISEIELTIINDFKLELKIENMILEIWDWDRKKRLLIRNLNKRNFYKREINSKLGKVVDSYVKNGTLVIKAKITDTEFFDTIKDDMADSLLMVKDYKEEGLNGRINT